MAINPKNCRKDIDLEYNKNEAKKRENQTTHVIFPLMQQSILRGEEKRITHLRDNTLQHERVIFTV